MKLLGSLLLGNLFRRLLRRLGLGLRSRRSLGLDDDPSRFRHLHQAGEFPLGFPTTRPSLLDLLAESEGVVFPLAGLGFRPLAIALGVEMGRIVAVGLAPFDCLGIVGFIFAHCVLRLTELLLIVKR